MDVMGSKEGAAQDDAIVAEAHWRLRGCEGDAAVNDAFGMRIETGREEGDREEAS
jgi:hypothetical protein